MTALQRLNDLDRLPPVMSWRNRFVILLLLLLPLQGLAASLTAFTCHSGQATHGDTLDHDHGGDPAAQPSHETAATHQHHQDDDRSSDHYGHQNCHQVFSAVPAVRVVADSDALPEFHSSLSLLSTLFVPERPQRPPRT